VVLHALEHSLAVADLRSLHRHCAISSERHCAVR
jgi:hypothetical protein